jgi:hypothetical protein
LFEALTRSVPPFNALFEVGLATDREDADAVDANTAPTSITTPRPARTPESSAFLRIYLLSDVFPRWSAGMTVPAVGGGMGAEGSVPIPAERFSGRRGACDSGQFDGSRDVDRIEAGVSIGY